MKLYSKKYGHKGQDLIIIHGLFGMSDNWNTLGKQFSKYCKAEDCAGVSSGTSALQLSLLALGIGPGDEVITVPYTWVSTAECIKKVGAKPIFVDIRKDFCINVDEIKEKINKKTKAIIGVDLYGNVCDIDSLKKFR